MKLFFVCTYVFLDYCCIVFVYDHDNFWKRDFKFCTGYMCLLSQVLGLICFYQPWWLLLLLCHKWINTNDILHICFRSDITALLLSTLSFLWSCCKSVPSLLDPQCTVAPFPTIHSLCSCLLTTLVRSELLYLIFSLIITNLRFKLMLIARLTSKWFVLCS